MTRIGTTARFFNVTVLAVEVGNGGAVASIGSHISRIGANTTVLTRVSATRCRVCTESTRETVRAVNALKVRRLQKHRNPIDLSVQRGERRQIVASTTIARRKSSASRLSIASLSNISVGGVAGTSVITEVCQIVTRSALLEFVVTRVGSAARFLDFAVVSVEVRGSGTIARVGAQIDRVGTSSRVLTRVLGTWFGHVAVVAHVAGTGAVAGNRLKVDVVEADTAELTRVGRLAEWGYCFGTGSASETGTAGTLEIAGFECLWAETQVQYQLAVGVQVGTGGAAVHRCTGCDGRLAG